MRVISGAIADRRTTPLEEAYGHFRLDRQGLPVSPATLRLYEPTIGRFLRRVREEHPGGAAVRGPGRGRRAAVPGGPDLDQLADLRHGLRGGGRRADHLLSGTVGPGIRGSNSPELTIEPIRRHHLADHMPPVLADSTSLSRPRW